MPEPLTFEPNKEYVRGVLASSCDWTSYDAQFVPVVQLPPDHRYFAYQRAVNRGGCPSEQVVEEHRKQFGAEFRAASDGPHPLASLSEEGPHEAFAYMQAVNNSQRGAAE